LPVLGLLLLLFDDSVRRPRPNNFRASTGSVIRF
jgi:hypothetical protein